MFRKHYKTGMALFFFRKKSPSAGKSDGWDELMNATGRDDGTGICDFPSSKKMFCMLMSLIGAVMAMRLVW